MKYPMLAARAFDTPLWIAPTKLSAILQVLGPRMGFQLRSGGGIDVGPARQTALHDDEVASPQSRHYELVDGVAKIPIIGTLIHRGDAVDAMSGLTSYTWLADAHGRALADPNVRAILFEIDSGGGEANGCYDLSERIFAARGQKPTWAISSDWADSAAYFIASACDRVLISQSGEVGSIGVMLVHVDYSAQNEMLGEAVTYLYRGKHKPDCYPDFPLSDQARESLQADVDYSYRLFTETVARNRDLAVEAVSATEARTYRAEDAIAIGLADEISSVQSALSMLALEGRAPTSLSTRPARAANAQNRKEQPIMTTAKTAGAAPANTTTQEAPQQSAPDSGAITAAHAEGVNIGQSAGQTSERTRIAGILGCEEAKGRDGLAKHLAFSTDMAIDAAKAVMAASPIATPVQTDPLAAAMSGVKNPQVGADVDGSVADDPAALASAIVSAHRAASGQVQQRGN